MFSLFAKYTSVGVINTLIHWAVFTVLYSGGSTQSLSNFTAFCIAVTFSFFVNAKWTFKAEATAIRYMMYVLFMGSMAAIVGWLADKMHISAIITLIVFSAISLLCGFVYSKLFIFREK